ncbi:MAG: hypothetical protein ABIV36_23190, partial [Sphingobium limneticum]
LVALGDPEQKPLLYACATCGAAHSPSIYLATKERQHEAAREAAADCYTCKTHNICKYCGEQCHKGSLACRTCSIAHQIESAAEIPDDGGPYFGLEGDGPMYHDLEEARDDGHDWVMPATEAYPRIDADDIFENLTGDMFEDASMDDLKGTTEFAAAVKAFNDAQTTVTYWGDPKRKIRVPAAPADDDEGPAE